MLYVLMFGTSSFLFYLGDKTKERGRLLFHFLGVLLPVLMAALRDERIGNDILGYVKPMFLQAGRSDSLADYFIGLASRLNTRDLEYGFSIIGYIATKTTGSLQGVFGIYEAIMIIPIYLAIRKYNENITAKYNVPQIKMWMGMFCYYTMFYNMSLTMVRQSLACSLLVYCMICFMSGYKIRAFLILASAISFHSTAAVGIVIILLFLCIESEWKCIRRLIIPLGILFAVAGGQMYWIVMKLLSKIIPIPARYLTFEYMWNQGNGLNIAFIYLIFCAFICAWDVQFRNIANNKFLIFEKYIVWCAIFLTPMSIAAANVSRVLYYFFYFFIFIIPLAADRNTRFRTNNKTWIPVLICIVYWLGTVLFNDYTGTVNYILA